MLLTVVDKRGKKEKNILEKDFFSGVTELGTQQLVFLTVS